MLAFRRGCRALAVMSIPVGFGLLRSHSYSSTEPSSSVDPVKKILRIDAEVDVASDTREGKTDKRILLYFFIKENAYIYNY